ncbi:predicted protein [Streptomyces viridosporus ATCC 14672]|uniref:Predicted protein n=1 Tax=Streptomyces viridosporus (strain ATCC 14672 / DSM 40746 / JCM 4963 / KCTC 9882 / NRRL B-12104 / FH 1290) TaxID=566461 RepID=D6A407_STRV1|nr:predicted protein [Streptomyces viridosporus ATCC 14672]
MPEHLAARTASKGVLGVSVVAPNVRVPRSDHMFGRRPLPRTPTTTPTDHVRRVVRPQRSEIKPGAGRGRHRRWSDAVITP